MSDILRRMEENSVTYRDRALLADASGRSLTYGEFYEVTGRVYAYLKQHGIGLEDFVLVCLPRGVDPICAICGVLRAGAAFVLVEDVLPPDRIGYIRMDCGCKLTIDEACWQEILGTDPISGFEPRDDKSAAFAVYTSGTTGMPKGVLHEYGNIALMSKASPLPDGPMVERFALCSPLNFILSAMASLVLVAEGTTLIFVVPLEVVKDPAQFRTFLVSSKVTFAFLSPLFVKKMAPILSSLVFCVVGSEPANDLFSEDFAILNGYTMSEVGFTIASCLIDKPYSNTPVGTPAFDCPIRLVGEDGKDVPDGEKGEIVVWNPYVRGYINLPEKTAAAFKDGWYYTGDLGMRDEQGRLVVCGRIDDMAKVNGNRVEPGEIEVAAREVLGLSWAAARIFNESGRTFTCLYYLDDVEIDAQSAREKLSERLPHYMLPSFFAHIDKIPLTPAGKFNRRALQAPALEDERVEYRAPENETQRALCTAFSKVFDVDAVGIGDDFSRLGGDSVNAMEIVVSSGLEGLSVADVLQGKTPEGIAEIYLTRASQVNPDEVNALALEKSYLPMADQTYAVEAQLRDPASTLQSINTLLRLDRNVFDITRMASALSAAAKNHPALFTEFCYDETGEIRQKFSADLMGDIEVEHLSEDEFEQVKTTLVQPFTIIGAPLFRARVFETEAAGYIFIDVHHAVFDGSSQGILLADVMAAYKGEALSKDYYPYLLEMHERENASVEQGKGASFLDARYDGVDWCRHLAISGDPQDSPVGMKAVAFPMLGTRLDDVEKLRGVSRNGFFSIATALAVTMCEDASDVMLFWAFNGRTNARELHSVGSLRSYLPLAFSFGEDATLGSLCASASEQVGFGIAHCRERYLERHASLLDEGVIRVLYQGAMKSTPQMPGFLGTIPLGRANLASRAFVNLEIDERGDNIAVTIRYTANCFSDALIEEFAHLFEVTVEALVAHSDAPDVTFAALKQEIVEGQ